MNFYRFISNWIFIFIFLISGLSSKGQIQLTGKVTSKETKEPLSFTSIFIKNKNLGTTTNVNGEFLFTIPVDYSEDTIVFSYLGYTPFLTRVSKIKTTAEVSLSRDTASLKTIVVTAESAESIVRKAIKAISTNYSTYPFIAKGFYRITSHNGYNYVHLSESVFETYQSKTSKPRKQFKLNKLRSIKDLRFSKSINLGATPDRLYSFDIVDNYQDSELLSEKGLKNHEFTFAGYETINGRPVYKIEFNQKRDNFAGYKGFVLIDSETLAFLHFDLILSPKGAKYYKYSTAYKRQLLKNLNGLEIKIPSFKYVISYRNSGDKYYLESIRGTMEMNIKNIVRDYLLKFNSSIDYIVTSTTVKDVDPFNKSEILGKNTFIETEESNFDKDFWNNYTIIVPTVDFEKEARRINSRNKHFQNQE